MPAKNIVIGQRVTDEKKEAARELRKNMTPAERALWERLRGNRLGGWHFRRQQIIAGFIVDFYCHRAGLVVEVDGSVHDELGAADAERTAILEGIGLRVLRFRNIEIARNIEQVLDVILEACTHPPSPFPTREGGEDSAR